MIISFIHNKLTKSRLLVIKRKSFNLGHAKGISEMEEVVSKLKKDNNRKEQKLNRERALLTNKMYELNTTIMNYEKLIVELNSIRAKKGIIHEELIQKRIQLLALDAKVDTIQRKSKKVLK